LHRDARNGNHFARPEIQSERFESAPPLIGMTTTPIMRRFLIIFSIVEAAMIAWAFIAPHIR
jgi:hypothetical protein